MATNSGNRIKIEISKKKKFTFVLISFILSIILALIIAEVIFRIIPIPGVEFNSTKFDPLVGTGFYPHSLLIYRNEEGDFIKRKVNSWGYLDIEHEKKKRKGIYRIGFFGDSWTEAKQVPLENTFFRITERKLKSYNVECMAFGNSGISTLQSYLNSKRWMDYFDLDLVIYVFCENDIGENIKQIRNNPVIPYAVLTNNGFQVDNSFKERYQYKLKFYYKIGDYLTSHSLVIATLYERIQLLMQYGVKFSVSEEDRMMATRFKGDTDSNEMPGAGDLPSTWPDSLRNYAEELGSAILLKCSNEVKEHERKFAVLYIPRTTAIEKTTEYNDSWKFWLESLCESHNIIFIDPTTNLLKKKLSGEKIYYDHFTKEGHAAFTDSFVEWFIRYVNNR